VFPVPPLAVRVPGGSDVAAVVQGGGKLTVSEPVTLANSGDISGRIFLTWVELDCAVLRVPPLFSRTSVPKEATFETSLPVKDCGRWLVLYPGPC